MSRQLNISRHDNTVTLDGASGPGFVCSVPDEFIDAVPSGTWTVGSAEDGTTEPAPVDTVADRLGKLAREAPESHGRYWPPRTGEDVDVRHVATRIAGHLRKRAALAKVEGEG